MFRPSDDNCTKQTALEISVDEISIDEHRISPPMADPLRHGTFDPYDKNSWFFGDISREDADKILQKENEDGVFLVRSSTSMIGSYVLCVRESTRESNISHYIIFKMASEEGKDGCTFQIGTQVFADMPAILNNYRNNMLESTCLIRPAHRRFEKYVAKFDFEPREPDDLGFRKGEILQILSKEEDYWWMARNSTGSDGKIPYNYVEPYDENKRVLERPTQKIDIPPEPESRTPTAITNMPKNLPAFARVKRARNPCAYDKTALRLEVGDIIKVTKTNASGTWEGELVEKKKVGHFPFTYVDWIDDGQSGGVGGRESTNGSLSNASSNGSGDLKSDFRGSTDPLSSVDIDNRFSSNSADWAAPSQNGSLTAPRPASLHQ